jgi:hypothetical protein
MADMTREEQLQAAHRLCRYDWQDWTASDVEDAAAIVRAFAALATPATAQGDQGPADRIAALEAAIYRVLNPAPGVRRIEPWAHGILSVALSSKPATAQCRMCGKTGLSTAEAGGPERIIGGEV